MVKNTQYQSISNIIIFLIILLGVASIQISNTYGAIKDQNFDMGKCKNEPETLTVLCCWTETDEEGIEIEYCQSCNVDTDKGEISNECGEVFTDNTTPPTASDSVDANLSRKLVRVVTDKMSSCHHSYVRRNPW